MADDVATTSPPGTTGPPLQSHEGEETAVQGAGTSEDQTNGSEVPAATLPPEPAPPDAESKRKSELEGGTPSQNTTTDASVDVAAESGPFNMYMAGIVEGNDVPLNMDPGDVRVYESTVTTKMKRGGKTDVAEIPIDHKVASKRFNGLPLAASSNRSDNIMSTGFCVGTDDVEFVRGAIIDSEGMPEMGSLGGEVDYGAIIERLVSAASRYVNTGKISWYDLSDGNESVYNRESVGGRVESPHNAITMPYPVKGSRAQSSWIGVMGACLGTGSIVLTNKAPQDSGGSVVYETLSDYDLAECIVCAISELMRIGEESKAGGICLFSAARGWHYENEAVACTAEGSSMSRLYCSGSAATSHGVVVVKGENCKSWPVPSVCSQPQVMQWLDSMGLYTAAAVAVADPCEKVGDKWFPTVITSGSMSPDIMLEAPPGAAELLRMRSEIKNRIANLSPSWCFNMAKILSGASGGTMKEQNIGVLVRLFKTSVSAVARHMSENNALRCMTPFFWIEPQNIFGSEAHDYTNGKECMAIYAARGGGTVEVPMFEKVEVLGATSSHLGQLHIDYSMARRNLGIGHLRYSKAGGLEYMIPLQFREESIVLCGSRDGHSGTFKARARAGDCFDDYMWSHSDIGTPMLGECLQYSPGMLLEVYFGKAGSRRKAGAKYFDGSMSDLDQNLKVNGSQLRIGTVHKLVVRSENETNRNNMICLVNTRAAYGMNVKDKIAVNAISSSWAYGTDMANEKYKMDEPLRLIIEANSNAERQRNCYAAMNARTRTLEEYVGLAEPIGHYSGIPRHNAKVYGNAEREGAGSYGIDSQLMGRDDGREPEDEYDALSYMREWNVDAEALSGENETSGDDYANTKPDVCDHVKPPDEFPVEQAEVEEEAEDEYGTKTRVTRTKYRLKADFEYKYVMKHIVKMDVDMVRVFATLVLKEVANDAGVGIESFRALDRMFAKVGMDVFCGASPMACMLMSMITKNCTAEMMFENARLMVMNSALEKYFIHNIGVADDEDEDEDGDEVEPDGDSGSEDGSEQGDGDAG